MPQPYSGLAWGDDCSFPSTGGLFPFQVPFVGALEGFSASQDLADHLSTCKLHHFDYGVPSSALKHGRLYGICTIDPTICPCGLYRRVLRQGHAKASRGFPCAAVSATAHRAYVLHPVQPATAVHAQLALPIRSSAEDPGKAPLLCILHLPRSFKTSARPSTSF